MPLAAEDVLKKLIAAIEEAKATTRDLHVARASALDVIKKQRKELAEAIESEVHDVVHNLSADTRQRLAKAVDDVIDSIARDWRTKLGLDEAVNR